MPDLNKTMVAVQKESKELEQRLKRLYSKYENLHKDGHRNLTHEKNVSGSMEGLESFQHLVLILRRNRDIIRAMLRGVKSLRPIADFRFIEEDVESISQSQKKSLKKHSKIKSIKKHSKIKNSVSDTGGFDG